MKEVTADTITGEQIRELRRETFALWNKGMYVEAIDGVFAWNLAEQLDYETAALHADGGIVGPPHYHAHRISQSEARARCADAWNGRHGGES